ncbi:MAG TPA: MgtC/SapB family protein [Anaerolineae bacterium]|nr:MgtC/SapB family protein [Anaerolineae bacterium]
MSPLEWTLFFKAATAAAAGFAIGREREAHGSPAGDRTLALVALGAAALTGLGMFAFPDHVARIIAGVITGVGFLGTGVIMRDGSGVVRGLTSAACIWTVAAVGVVIGAGHYWLGLALAGLVMLLLLCDRLPITKPADPAHQPEFRGRQDALSPSDQSPPATG